MPAPEAVVRLVERFEQNRDAYTSASYNETQTRREFIDPLFKALGWDVDNEQGYAEQWKEVVHEDALRVGGVTKAPDYSFRLGGRRLFFLEAKRPGANLKDDSAPAYQLRRYAWTAKLPVSILTNFEEFIVYDTRVRPASTDSSAIARIIYIRCEEYAARWDEIASIFSPQAIRKGAFDKYVESATKKRGTAEVDDAFLAEIAEWREWLAHNVALRNQGLSQRQLNYAVQATIDRIVFMRICEDRGIESYGRLQSLLNGVNVYARMRELYRLADERYNSGLFHFTKEANRPGTPDEITPGLIIDDKILKDILRRLYYPDCPYEFSVFPAEILGQVYERFLGSVIRLTSGGRARVEEKPEVRKAGGVYYTPAYVVSYIVQHTVGKLLEGKTPQDAAGLSEAWRPTKTRRPLAVLDPACGSGSFLIGAYQFLLDWHLEQYTKEPQKWCSGRQTRIYQHHRGGWRLTTAERKRILLANIFGVDIDPQAVEVTKLSLLLKVLEGESGETLERQLAFLHERALPDLAGNIKCGNSLIGPDFYNGHQMNMFDEDELYRVNAFDWKAEFPDIMRSGGFDAVIGNPPWGAEFTPDENSYLQSVFRTVSTRYVDSYAVFLEMALGRLRDGGLLGYITPDTFLRKDDYGNLRKHILSETTILQILETGPVFPAVRDTWCAIMLTVNHKPDETHAIQHRQLSRFTVSVEDRLQRLGEKDWSRNTTCLQTTWLHGHGYVVGYRSSDREQELIARLNSNPRLGQLNEFSISRGEEGSKFNISVRDCGLFKMILPSDVDRFCVGEGQCVEEDSLTPSKERDFYQHPKIWVIRIQKLRWRQRLVCALDPRRDSAGMKTLQVIVHKRDQLGRLCFLLGLLNSRLLNWWCVNYLADDMNKSYLSMIPLAEPAPANRAPASRMVSLVQQMNQLHKRLSSAATPHEQTLLKRRIAATDREIDLLVYRLYDLTDEEIAVVEQEEQ